jgi:hypothetical protein
VLVAAGSKDRHTTLEETQELFDAASQPKSLWIVGGAIHEDLFTFDPKGYEEHVVGYLRQNLGLETNLGLGTALHGIVELAGASTQLGKITVPFSILESSICRE